MTEVGAEHKEFMLFNEQMTILIKTIYRYFPLCSVHPAEKSSVFNVKVRKIC